MVSMRKAQTGARVYMGARLSPNRGQVSAQGAQGYIQRELRNKQQTGVVTPVGRDGRSDNRSTVAAQSLQRSRQMRPGGSNTPGKIGTGGPPRPPLPPGNDSHDAGPPRPPLNPNDPNGGGGSVVPQVQVNDAGLLELPYNQDFMMEQYAALRDANDQLLGLKSQGDQELLQYNQEMRDTGLAYGQQKAQTLNANAAGGTAFSSMYGTAVANNANQYANQVGDLNQAHTGFMDNLTLQRSTIQNALNQQLQALAQQYGDQLGNEAGSLGYGNDKQEIGQGTNSSVYANDPKRKKTSTGGPKRPNSNKGMSRTTAAQKALRKKARGR